MSNEASRVYLSLSYSRSLIYHQSIIQYIETFSSTLQSLFPPLPLPSHVILTPSLLHSASEVTIVLKNQGDEAYRHDVYGDSIIITRRFTKDGSSSYQIKSKAGNKVSTKREELSAICDHMNIQVDNPMNVLTQGTPFFSALSEGESGVLIGCGLL